MLWKQQHQHQQQALRKQLDAISARVQGIQVRHWRDTCKMFGALPSALKAAAAVAAPSICTCTAST
jgi:hypothetical protein